jgi:uncharacterized damage-inducible protein DinB
VTVLESAFSEPTDLRVYGSISVKTDGLSLQTNFRRRQSIGIFGGLKRTDVEARQRERAEGEIIIQTIAPAVIGATPVSPCQRHAIIPRQYMLTRLGKSIEESMTATANIRMLTRYNAWANKAIFDAVAALPAGEASKERPTIFKNMINTLNHLHVVDLIWQAHIEQRPHGITALNTVLYSDLADLWRAQQTIDTWFVTWGDTLSEADADEEVHFTLIGGKQGQMRRGEIVMHLVNHTSYHRGFVADMFCQIPARPPLTDLPVFLTAH